MNIDGMRQNFNVNGHQQRNGTLLIDPEFISSIEIDKGSQSGQGGAAVLGGIASFKTLDASEFLKDGKEYGGRIRAGHGIGELGNGTNFKWQRVCLPLVMSAAMCWWGTANGISAITARVTTTTRNWAPTCAPAQRHAGCVR